MTQALRYLTKRIPYWEWIAIAIGVLFFADALTYFWAERFWFETLGYLSIFWLRLKTQMILGVLGFGLSFGFLGGNLLLARRLQFSEYCILPSAKNIREGWELKQLLPVAFGLALIIALSVLYHGHLALLRWHLDTLDLNPLPPLPLWFEWDNLLPIVTQLYQQPWQGALWVAVALGLLIYPRLVGTVGALILSSSFSLVLAEQWSRIAPSLNPAPFGKGDPLFSKDISFYIFKLPVLELVEFWLVGLLIFALAITTLIYLLAGNSLSQGRFVGFSPVQQRHIYGLAGGLLVATSLGHWLTFLKLVYSTQGVTYGANFTDVQVTLPVNQALSLIALGLAIAMVWRTIFWSISLRGILEWILNVSRDTYAYIPPIPRRTPGSRFLIWAIGVYIVFTLIGTTAVPWLVQQLIVQPNELMRETPFIRRTIEFTREAFNLTDIQDEVFVPKGTLTPDDLKANDLTVRNIRLWDTRPLLQTNRQLQQIRLYYEFFDADIDRYNLIGRDGQTERRQVLIAARELNYERVPPEAQTWVNEHLIYTHGYGFTLSPVNSADSSGLPNYFVKDIGHVPSEEETDRDIPIGAPRIYFGELTNTYIMSSTKVKELDYPSGDGNIKNVYDGLDGINIGPFWKRLLFAKHLRDWQMLFTQDFTAQTKIHIHRNIVDRVARIAPFLQLDQDPYLVVADLSGAAQANQTQAKQVKANTPQQSNHLYWIIDGYTTSDRYPYSDPGQQSFNYIRNAVKVVVDACNGQVQFYIADDQDPIIQTWARLLPDMFHPLSEMPSALAEHIRYPQDYYLIQSDQILTYHMSDPQVYYNREDQWRAPNEIYANEAKLVEPYYLIMKLPQERSEEFILLRPFTPSARNNLVAWLAARSDGDRYGRLLLYRFPKEEQIFGPEQIEARINQDPEISQRISLWNTQGSKANQGNLLVIPIEQSLLYVEPLYLEAEENSLPTLARVIVAYKNRIAMAETLDQSLESVFSPSEPQEPAILRDLAS
jgi:uncharacterized protein